MGDLALVFCWGILFPFGAAGEVTPILGTWRGSRGTLVVPVAFLGVPVAFFGVLGLGMGSLDVAEAPPGVLRVGMGSFEAPPPKILQRGGRERLDRPLPVAVAPRLAAPFLAAPPPEVFLMGTGSLDFHAAWVPVPRVCLAGGAAATPPLPAVPANLSAEGGVTECLPVVAAEIEAVFLAMLFDTGVLEFG